MTPKITIQELALSLTAKNHSPTLLNADFLKHSGIVPADWELARPPIFSPQISQVAFTNGTNIVAQSNAITFIESLNSKSQETAKIPDIARKYVEIGAQKRLEQTKRRGRRLSILGLLQPCVSFAYGLAIGSFSSKSYITMMDNEAQQAELEMKLTGRIRVIIQDNGPIHKSLDVQQKWSQWESQGLYIFFLPKYCSEMNKIELEWQQLKNHELVGQMFEPDLSAYREIVSKRFLGQETEELVAAAPAAPDRITDG